MLASSFGRLTWAFAALACAAGCTVVPPTGGPGSTTAGTGAVPPAPPAPRIVNVETYARAQTDLQFAELAQRAGGVNIWSHAERPTPIDRQPVIRMNRDTLYSSALVDISAGATLYVPEFGSRYLSVMVIDNDHYVEEVIRTAGVHRLSVERNGSPYVYVVARIFVDPNDPADLEAVRAVQRGLRIDAASARPFVAPDWDRSSRERVQRGLAMAGQGLPDAKRYFGSRRDVDPVRHLLGTATGWGGLPEREAMYRSVNPSLPVGRYRIDVPAEVPADAFWSVSSYNADGYFERNALDAYSVNSRTVRRNTDGSATIHFGGCDDGRPNCLPITAGWNYTVRLYRPRPEVIDGRWAFPPVVPAR